MNVPPGQRPGPRPAITKEIVGPQRFAFYLAEAVLEDDTDWRPNIPALH